MTLLTSETIAIIGIFLGVASRIFLPYLRKTIKEGHPLVWQHRYTAILIVSLIITFLVYPQFSIPADGLRLFSAAFIFGFGISSATIEGFEWLKTKEGTEEPTP